MYKSRLDAGKGGAEGIGAPQGKPTSKYERSLRRDSAFLGTSEKKEDNKLVVWKLGGKLDIPLYQERYRELISDSKSVVPGFTSESAKESKKYDDTSFYVKDIRALNKSDKSRTIDAAVSYEARRIYDFEEDSMLRIMAYVCEDNEMSVILTYHPSLKMPINIINLRQKLFPGLTVIDGGNSFRNPGTAIRSCSYGECVEYWTALFKHSVATYELPAARQKPVIGKFHSAVHKVLDEGLMTKAFMFYQKEGATYFTASICAWAKLMKEYNACDNPVFLVSRRGNMTGIMPVTVPTNERQRNQRLALDNQLRGFLDFSNVDSETLCSIMGLRYGTPVKLLIEYTGNEEIKHTGFGVIAENYSLLDPLLHITFNMKDDGLEIIYAYREGVYDTDSIELLHQGFVAALEEIVEDGTGFNWRDFIDSAKNTDEKREKLWIAKKALHLADTGLVMNDNQERLMKAAIETKMINYIIDSVIVERGKHIGAIGIVIEGAVEEFARGRDGTGKSIYIYKPGNVIGIDTLCSEACTQYDYVACVDNTKILWLGENTVEKYILSNSGTVMKLIGKVVEDNHRLKRLWSLQ